MSPRAPDRCIRPAFQKSTRVASWTMSINPAVALWGKLILLLSRTLLLAAKLAEQRGLMVTGACQLFDTCDDRIVELVLMQRVGADRSQHRTTE
jgi:hypothetical protein